jgi:hypothetical protein
MSKMLMPLEEDEMMVDSGGLERYATDPSAMVAFPLTKDEHTTSSSDEIEDSTDVKEDVDPAAFELEYGNRAVGFDRQVVVVVVWLTVRWRS